MKDKPVLHLNLKKKWFDMIASGEKKEEYREIKPYWTRHFGGTYIRIKGKNYHPTDVLICFSNGYTKDRPQMLVSLKGMRAKEGKLEWGATQGQWYYTLIIDQIIKTTPIRQNKPK